MDRHFGRGYSPAGYYHAKSGRSMKNSYIDAVYSHINCINFFSNEIADRGINLFIGGSYHVVVTCKSNYVPFRNFVSARYEIDIFGRQTNTGPIHLLKMSLTNCAGRRTNRCLVGGIMKAKYIGLINWQNRTA